MPAGSEVRTWRPWGTRIVGALSIAVLSVAAIAIWIGLGPSIRAQFTAVQLATTIAAYLGLFAAWWAMARSRLSAGPEGVTVVNGYRTRHFEWAQVLAFRLRHGAPWAELDLSDGSTLAVFGVQGSDGRRARDAVREFRELMESHTPTDPN